MLSRLSLSAQTFFSPARCSSSNCTRCRCAHVAASLRNNPKGSAVLKSLFKPLSALVLSVADGSTNLTCLLRMQCQVHCAKASCAKVSKQPMYGCMLPCSCGHCSLTWSAVKTSLNQINCVDVLSQPPMPIRAVSAKASAAL